MRLTEAIKALQAQSGNVITDLREANGDEATNPALDLDIEDKPFFEAFDIIAEKAGVTFTPYTGDGTLGIMAGGMDPGHRTCPRWASRWCVYSGPFRIQFKQIAIVKDFGAANGTATAPVRRDVGAPAPADAPRAQERGPQDRRRPGQAGRSPRSTRRPTRPASAPATARPR